MILRLNPDGTTPRDNPFWKVGAERGGQVGNNLKKIYAYGLRNGFGMAFDPFSGNLWEQENGDDSFSEINLAEPGFNSGWTQVMGPLERVAQFKAIETTRVPDPPDPQAPNGYFGLQQVRWDPTNIADTPFEAYNRLFKLPGSEFSDPELTWKYEVAPGGIDFLSTKELGKEYKGDLFVGSARVALRGGNIFRLRIEDNRKKVDVSDDKRLKDRVADNLGKYEITESESLLFGENFGVTPDIKEGPDGTLFVVSNTQNDDLRDPPQVGDTRLAARVAGRARLAARSPAAQGPSDPGGVHLGSVGGRAIEAAYAEFWEGAWRPRRLAPNAPLLTEAVLVMRASWPICCWSARMNSPPSRRRSAWRAPAARVAS